MNQTVYLRRINYTGELSPTLEILNALQRTHLLHVPFENLDIHMNRPIELDISKFFEKIVVKRRGGFCYELNGLFFELLRSLGFAVRRISARVYDENEGFGEEFDHMVILTEIEHSSYLTDVGFGEFAFHPLKMEINTTQHDECGNFMIEKHDENYFLVSKKEGHFWRPQYLFTTTGRNLHEYRKMCEFHQTSPRSHFTQNKMCSLPTQYGRITLSGNELKIRSKRTTKTKTIQNEEEFNECLRRYFDIKIN